MTKNLDELNVGGSIIVGDSSGFSVVSTLGTGAVAVGGTLGKMSVGEDIIGRMQRARVAVAG